MKEDDLQREWEWTSEINWSFFSKFNSHAIISAIALAEQALQTRMVWTYDIQSCMCVLQRNISPPPPSTPIMTAIVQLMTMIAENWRWVWRRWAILVQIQLIQPVVREMCTNNQSQSWSAGVCTTKTLTQSFLLLCSTWVRKDELIIYSYTNSFSNNIRSNTVLFQTKLRHRITHQCRYVRSERETAKLINFFGTWARHRTMDACDCFPWTKNKGSGEKNRIWLPWNNVRSMAQSWGIKPHVRNIEPAASRD